MTDNGRLSGPHQLPSADAHVERIERFQSLSPGTYWRATKNNGDVENDTVLLLLDVREVDGKPHTVVLMGHPEEGEGTYALLVNEFLDAFVLEPNGEAVRQREMAAVQEEVNALQRELLVGQHNPTHLAPRIEAALKELDKRHKKAPRKKSALAPILPISPGRELTLSGAIGTGITEDGVAELQRIAERQAVIAEVQGKWIKEKTDSISRAIERLAPYYAEKAAVALAQTNAARKRAEAIQKGLASLDLYTGKCVDVQTIAHGTPAPANEPLTLMQRKLFADEELAAWADVSERFDAWDLDTFDEHLAANASLRDQLLPYPRCVVSVAARRRDLDYGNAFESLARNKENKRVFLLVRDGENIHKVVSGQPSHEHARRLFPTRNELDDPFIGVDGSRVTFDDISYVDSMDEADARVLHYKRFLILLCGLDHRLKLFGAFYPANEFGSFMTLPFQERYFRFVRDDEADRLLGAGRPSVDDWVREKNSYLRSGSRVLCAYDRLLTPESAPACVRHDTRQQYRSLRWLAEPRRHFGEHVVYADKGELCVSVRVKRDSWRELKYPEFDARVSLTAALKSDAALSFLCLDAVRAEELEWYVHNRQSRVRHVEFIRLFKKTAAALREEAKAESSARDYLSSAIAGAGLAQGTALTDLIDTAVRAWRAANGGRALPTASDKRELEPLLGYAYSFAHQANELVERVDEYVAKNHLSPLKLTLSGKNRLALYVAVPQKEQRHDIVEWRWVRRIGLVVKKRSLASLGDRLVWLSHRADAGENELKRWPELDSWINEAEERHRPRALADARRLVDAGLSHGCALFPQVGGIPDALFESFVARFKRVRREASRRLVARIDVAVPIGVYSRKIHGHWQLTYLVLAEEAHLWVREFGTSEQKRRMKAEFMGYYKNQEYAAKQWNRPFQPQLMSTTRRNSDLLLVPEKDLFSPYGMWEQPPATKGPDRSLAHFLKHAGECSDGPRAYINPLAGDGGSRHIERLFARKRRRTGV